LIAGLSWRICRLLRLFRLRSWCGTIRRPAYPEGWFANTELICWLGRRWIVGFFRSWRRRRSTGLPADPARWRADTELIRWLGWRRVVRASGCICRSWSSSFPTEPPRWRSKTDLIGWYGRNNRLLWLFGRFRVTSIPRDTLLGWCDPYLAIV
jgi:hypothetical protein